MDRNLCFVPDVNIDDDNGVLERQLAYLGNLLEDVRGLKSCYWQFGFDLVWNNHAHGPVYMVEGDEEYTEIWESAYEEPRKRAKYRGRQGPPPRCVTWRGPPIHDISAESLLEAIGFLNAARVMAS